jgi:hypothetical protein
MPNGNKSAPDVMSVRFSWVSRFVFYTYLTWDFKSRFKTGIKKRINIASIASMLLTFGVPK